MPRPLDQLEQEKAALELRLEWLRTQPVPCPKSVLDTNVKLSNVRAIISMYKPHDITPNPA